MQLSSGKLTGGDKYSKITCNGVSVNKLEVRNTVNKRLNFLFQTICKNRFSELRS